MVRKTLAEDQQLQLTFAGLVDRVAPSNVGVLIWGTTPAGGKVVAHIAGLLGAPAPA